MSQPVISKSTPVTIGVVGLVVLVVGWLFSVQATSSEARNFAELNATKIEAIEGGLKEAPTTREIDRIFQKLDIIDANIADLLKKK